MPSERLIPPTHDDLAVNSTDGRADRRAFLKKAGIVGAGVAGATWAAPSILALDKAFAAPGSCCAQQTWDLLGNRFGDGFNLVNGKSNNTGLGTRVTVTSSTPDTITNTTCGTGGSWTTGVITDCLQGGDSAGQIAMVAVGTDKTPIVIGITFSTPVHNLSFVLTDIDASADPGDTTVEYQEQVTVAWTNSSGTSVPTYSPGSGLSLVGPNVYKSTSPTANAVATVTTNNLGVDFQCGGYVKTLTITSTNLNTTTGTSNTFGRYIGIAEIKFCL